MVAEGIGGQASGVVARSPKASLSASLIYKAESGLCVCFTVRSRVSCSVIVKLPVAAEGPGGQVIAGLTAPVLRLEESILPFPLLSSRATAIF